MNKPDKQALKECDLAQKAWVKREVQKAADDKRVQINRARRGIVVKPTFPVKLHKVLDTVRENMFMSGFFAGYKAGKMASGKR